MKWFKHDVDMHTDFRMIELIQKHGAEGYAVWNLCLEFLGKEGEKLASENRKFQLNSGKNWKNHIQRVANLDNKKVEEILETLAELKLICHKSLKRGALYSVGFEKRADDYTTRKLRTMSEQDTNNVHLEKNRLDKIRIEYIKAIGLEESHLKTDDYGRIHKAIKNLVIKADQKDDLVIAGIHWITEISAGKWSWTLETLLKKWPEFMKWNSMGEIERKYLKNEPRR